MLCCGSNILTEMKEIWGSGPVQSLLDLFLELLTVISGKFNNCIPRNNIKFNIFLIYQYPPKRRFTNDHQEESMVGRILAPQITLVKSPEPMNTLYNMAKGTVWL